MKVINRKFTDKNTQLTSKHIEKMANCTINRRKASLGSHFAPHAF